MSAKKILFGILFIVIGILIVLSLFQIIILRQNIFAYWPALLMAYGISGLFEKYDSKVFHGLLTLYSTLFLLKNLDVAFMQSVPMFRLGLAFLIIYVGLEMLFTHPFKKAASAIKRDTGTNSYNNESGDVLKRHSSFSSDNLNVNSSNFLSGEFSASFGSLEISMLGTTLHPEGATIHANVSFGSIKFFIPVGTNVKLLSAITLGSAHETVRNFKINKEGPMLMIHASGAFGGVEICYI